MPEHHPTRDFDAPVPEPDPPTERRPRGVHWPTVAVSGGVAAMASAVVIAVAVGTAAAQLPAREPGRTEVVAIGAGATPAPSMQVAGEPSASATTPPSTTPPAETAAGVGAAHGGASAAAPAPGQTAAATTAAPKAPSAPDAAALDADMRRLLGPGVGDGDIAAAMEGGGAAVPTVRQVAAALQTAGPVYSWRVEGPVTVAGDIATANLRTSLVGWADRTAPISWRWMDGRWRLTNRSVCDLAANAMATCTV